MKDKAMELGAQRPALIGLRFNPGEDIDGALRALAEVLAARGLTVAGVVQERGQATGDCACREMRLHDLSGGDVSIISEKRGPMAKGCHLDWAALTEIAQRLEAGVSEATDVLIINRFGRSESEGRGFRAAIEKALALEVQVIVGYRDDYAAAWEAFHGGLSRECSLADDLAALVGGRRDPVA